MGFETKDSGVRQQFESGMVRDTSEDKTLWHLIIDGPLLKRYAELLTRGAKKYQEKNWMKASGHEELRRFKESAFRHFIQWAMGQTDEDHAAAVVFNLNGFEYVKDRMLTEKVFVKAECSHERIYWDGQLGYVCEACGEAGVNRNRGAD